MPFDQPLLIIEPHPVEERLAKLLHGLKRAHPQELLFERPNEPLRHAVAFWGTDKCRTRRDAQKSEFGLEIVTHILTAMIMPHLQVRRAAGGDGPKLLAHPLANRLQGLKPRGPLRRMDANPFERAMIHPDEDRDGPVFHRHRAGRIRAPHLVRTLRRDRAVVDSWADDAWGSPGGQEAGLPHEPQHTGFRGANPSRPQPRPDFAMAFPEKR